MNIHQIEDLKMYLRYLQENPHEIDLLFKEFLINVTNFFRDAEAFESIKISALKPMIEEKSEFEVLRVWVLGCSSGEEVYSIAILINELLEELDKKIDVQIFGTDLDANSIKTARSGSYSGIISKDISQVRLKKYFYKNDNVYTIKNEIRDMVVFATHNLIKDPPFTKLDIISCRNLLIYLETVAQEKVLSNFNYALKQDGILFLGPSETIGKFIGAFSVVDKRWKIFKCIKSSGPVFDIIESHSMQYQKNSIAYWDSKFDLKDTKSEKAGLICYSTGRKKINRYICTPFCFN